MNQNHVNKRTAIGWSRKIITTTGRRPGASSPWWLTLAAGWLLLSVLSCSDDSNTASPEYNPSLPITLEAFMPDTGSVRSKFMVKGNNFGTDLSLIKVLFSDDEKAATVIGADHETIYCLVPKQNDGYNTIKVVVGADTAVFNNQFRYSVTRSVSTIAGVQGDNSLIDGTLSEARFNYLYGVAAVSNGDILVAESNAGNIRYISEAANSVSTLMTGFSASTPAVTADRRRVYFIGKASPHRVYYFEESGLWEPQLLVSAIPGFSGNIWSVALDKDQEWLYFFDAAGQFGRLEIASPANVEVLATNLPRGNGTHNNLAYSAYDDCFFFSIYTTQAVYKLSKDGTNCELWIGGNGQGVSTGHRTETAQLYYPAGLTVDENGNIYCVNIDGNTILKCDRKTDYVSLVAGVPLTKGHKDGDPLEALFFLPYGISIDEAGNFIICECWGSGVIRKLAIE
jgi:DNA-binding beta-propeller fold protein YncE